MSSDPSLLISSLSMLVTVGGIAVGYVIRRQDRRREDKRFSAEQDAREQGLKALHSQVDEEGRRWKIEREEEREHRAEERRRWDEERERWIVEREEYRSSRAQEESEKRITDAVERFNKSALPFHARRYAAMKTAFTLLRSTEEVKEAIRRLDRLHVRPYETKPTMKHILGAHEALILGNDSLNARTFFDELEIENGAAKNVRALLVRMQPELKREIEEAQQSNDSDDLGHKRGMQEQLRAIRSFTMW